MATRNPIERFTAILEATQSLLADQMAQPKPDPIAVEGLTARLWRSLSMISSLQDGEGRESIDRAKVSLAASEGFLRRVKESLPGRVRDAEDRLSEAQAAADVVPLRDGEGE